MTSKNPRRPTLSDVFLSINDVKSQIDGVQSQIDGVQSQIDTVATKEELDTAVASLATKKELDTAVGRLEDSIKQEAGDLGESIAALSDMVADRFGSGSRWQKYKLW